MVPAAKEKSYLDLKSSETLHQCRAYLNAAQSSTSRRVLIYCLEEYFILLMPSAFYSVENNNQNIELENVSKCLTGTISLVSSILTLLMI